MKSILFRIFFRAFKRAHDAVDAVAGITEDAPHAPLMKSFNQKIAARFAHKKFLLAGFLPNQFIEKCSLFGKSNCKPQQIQASQCKLHSESWNGRKNIFLHEWLVPGPL